MLTLCKTFHPAYKHNKEHNSQFGVKMYNAPLTHQEAYSAFCSRYATIATYPYTVTIFKTKELHQIQQKPFLRKILPKLGINRNTPRAVIFGPREIGGRQTIDLQVEQPVRNFTATIGHLRWQDKVSALLLATLQDLQIEVGISTEFFHSNPANHSYITQNTRWGYTWNMIWEFKLKLVVDRMWLPKKKYRNDCNIMEVAIQDRKYQEKNRYKLQTINHCRLYQEAFYISDLADRNGTTIPIEYLNGKGKHKNSEIAFPEMLAPTKLQWNEWKSFIFRNFLTGAKTFHPDLGQRLMEVNEIPVDEITILSQQQEKKSTLQNHINTLPTSLKQVINNIKGSATSGILVNVFKKGNLIGATDGSLINTNSGKRGAHSYILCNINNNDGMIKGSCATPVSTGMTFLTTEIYRILAIITILLYSMTIQFNEIKGHETPVIIYCDNDQAVTMANKQ